MSLQVASNTTYDAQYCSCTHLTSFASTWIVPPTPLDFNYIFANAGFAKNLTIYITTIVIYVVFIFILLWARRRDRKDLLKVGMTMWPGRDKILVIIVMEIVIMNYYFN